MRRIGFNVLLFLSVLGLGGACDSDDSGGSDGAAPAGSGCIQGVAIDAMTGNRVPLVQSGADKGIFVLQRAELRFTHSAHLCLG